MGRLGGFYCGQLAFRSRSWWCCFSCAVVPDAFGHLKAIAVDQGSRALLRRANIGQDVGVVGTDDMDAFITVAKTRQWDREKYVRTLA
jgi:hypothetical protein